MGRENSREITSTSYFYKHIPTIITIIIVIFTNIIAITIIITIIIIYNQTSSYTVQILVSDTSKFSNTQD